MTNPTEIVARAIACEIAQPAYTNLDVVPGKDAAIQATLGLAAAAIAALSEAGYVVIGVSTLRLTRWAIAEPSSFGLATEGYGPEDLIELLDAALSEKEG